MEDVYTVQCIQCIQCIYHKLSKVLKQLVKIHFKYFVPRSSNKCLLMNIIHSRDHIGETSNSLQLIKNIKLEKFGKILNLVVGSVSKPFTLWMEINWRQVGFATIKENYFLKFKFWVWIRAHWYVECPKCSTENNHSRKTSLNSSWGEIRSHLDQN